MKPKRTDAPTFTVPDVGASAPVMRASSVDLPAPLAPRMP